FFWRIPFSNLAIGFITFAMMLAIIIMGPSRPWSDRYLFSLLNAFQRLSTWEVLTALKPVELLSAVTLRTSLEGRSTHRVGRESFDLKRSRSLCCQTLLTRKAGTSAYRELGRQCMFTRA